MIGISMAVGGGVSLYGSYYMKSMATKAKDDVKVIEMTEDLKDAGRSTTQNNAGTIYATFTGETKPYRNEKIDIELIKPYVVNENVGFMLNNVNGKPTRIQKFEVKEVVKKENNATAVEEKVMSSMDFGQSLAIDGGSQWKPAVVVQDKANYESMLKMIHSEYVPLPSATAETVATGILQVIATALMGPIASVFFSTEKKDRVLGHKTVISTVASGQEVSGVGVLELKKLNDEFVWSLKPSYDKDVKGRPSFLVYGTKEQLLEHQRGIALGENVWAAGLLVVGLALIGGGGYVAFDEIKQQQQKK